MFASLIERIALALDNAALPYMVIGGQAVLLHGEPRLTRDIDITVAADLTARGRRGSGATRTARSACRSDDFTRRTMVLPCRDPDTGIRVDFILSFSPYERMPSGGPFSCRSERPRCDRDSRRSCDPQDSGGPARDLDDARAILLKNPNIDVAEVRRVLQEFQEGLERGTELTDRIRRDMGRHQARMIDGLTRFARQPDDRGGIPDERAARLNHQPGSHLGCD